MATGPDTLMAFPAAACYLMEDRTEYGVDTSLQMLVFPQHVEELKARFGATLVDTASVEPVITKQDADADTGS